MKRKELKMEFKDSLYWTNYDQRRLNNTNKSSKIKKNIKIYTKQRQLKDLLHKQILYPGIKFDHNSRPIEVVKPLDLHELKFIVALKCNIELRSNETARIYTQSKK